MKSQLFLLAVIYWAGFAAAQNIDDERREAQLAAIKNHGALEHARGGVILLKHLSEEIVYPKGQVSLVADPKDSSGEEIAVFLINDTDAPLAGAVSEWSEVVQEVNGGGRWRRVTPFYAGCGSIAPPRDLMPGEALLIRAANPKDGDVEGELRYRLRSRNLVSQTVPGKFDSKDLEAAGVDYAAYSGVAADIQVGLEEGKWAYCENAKTPEEVAAVLELDRSFDESWLSRRAAGKWLEGIRNRKDLSAEEKKGVAKIREVLAAPWPHVLDRKAALERCLVALAPRKDGDEPAYGTPEKLPVVVWRFLLKKDRMEYLTLEQEAALEQRTKSGNSWGASPDQLVSLHRAALRSIQNGSEDERKAATAFLCEPWWSVDLVTNDDLFGLLKKDTSYPSGWIIDRLVERGKREEILSWLVNDPQLDGVQRDALWSSSVVSRVPLGEKDLQLFKGSLKRGFGGVDVIGRMQRNPDWKAGKIPAWSADFRLALREALEREAVSQSIKGPDAPALSPEGQFATQSPEDSQKSQNVSYLGSAIVALAAWNMPEDLPLIRSFLSHPANSFAISSQVLRTYPLRNSVVMILRERGEKVDLSTVVLEEKFR